jgi:hypothetical protein
MVQGIITLLTLSMQPDTIETMNTLETLDLPWEVITLIGADKIPATKLHLYNAILYGIAERYKRHGLEWIKTHAHEIRTQICAAARYAGEDLCGSLHGCGWEEACAEADSLLADDIRPAADATTPDLPGDGQPKVQTKVQQDVQPEVQPSRQPNGLTHERANESADGQAGEQPDKPAHKPAGKSAHKPARKPVSKPAE